MNKEDLVLKLIDKLVGSETHAVINNLPASSIYDQYVGKHVIVRTRNEGINFGLVKVADDTGIVLSDCRRIWYHKPANNDYAWYEGVAVSGLSGDSKASVAVPEKAIIEDYSITLCTDDAVKSIQEHKTHGQS